MVAYWILCNIDVGLLTENQLIKPPELCLQAKVKSTVCECFFSFASKYIWKAKGTERQQDGLFLFPFSKF